MSDEAFEYDFWLCEDFFEGKWGRKGILPRKGPEKEDHSMERPGTSKGYNNVRLTLDYGERK